MSRIGKQPVDLPKGVDVKLAGQVLTAKGPKGELSLTLVEEVTASQGEDGITIAPRDDSKRARAMWGMQRTLVSNMLQGVGEGYSKKLELNGVGYRAQMKGSKQLQLQLGFSHDVVFDVPEGIEIKCESPTLVEVSGVDKQRVGQIAADIRKFRPPEPYKGKGIKYAGEYIERKEGKKK